MTVGELVQHTAKRLAAPELLSEDPQQEAQELVAHALGLLPAELPDRWQSALDSVHHGEFMRLLSRRLNAEPTGYIVGAVELLGLRFKVDRRGFIPRLDLPVLINAALERAAPEVSGFALDLACGIGAAGICVARARPGLRVDLTDVSTEAIELARENAERLIPGRALCFAGDLFEPLSRGRRYAIVTANPPWVPDGTELPEEVINHEPAVSFFGGPDGLDVVRRLIGELPEWLAPRGVYAQECDPSQVEKVIGLLTGAGLRDPRAHCDKEGVRRVVSAQNHG
ncbi:MAG: peptide chain release factor N(5)-glutamine methyltransferase [Deltaproteobacteria bacterium]|nr:MAG: peptide chain release factor N(5)-glutamine methyltransferase [Deltaproteobacteria bacterium]